MMSKPKPTKKVQVFLLLGQSNMLGMGRVKGDKDGTLEHAVRSKQKYPYLIDDDGNWTTDPRVRQVFIMGSGDGQTGKIVHNEWMTVEGHNKIGPEIGIGHVLSKYYHSLRQKTTGTVRARETDDDDGDDDNDTILLLKSCIGNRSLGWDLLPPGSPSYQYTDPKTQKVWTYALSLIHI